MRYVILNTEVKGKAVFAKEDIPASSLIGEYFKNFPNSIFKSNIFGFYDRELGRYCNHVNKTNTYVVKVEDGYDLYSNRLIKKGEEIGVSYLEMEQLSNVPKYTFYKNHFIPDILTNFGSGNIDKEKLV